MEAETENNMNVFGEYMKEMLIKRSISLRELARRTEMDASNLSKIERGKVYPPQKEQTLQKLAEALKLSSEEKQRFFELAALANGMIPEELEHVRKNKAIPLLLRVINNKQLQEQHIKKLAEMVEKENRWQGRVID